jgi:hypothetical protein
VSVSAINVTVSWLSVSDALSWVTVTATVALAEPLAAVIVAGPLAIAVTNPTASTVATPVADDDHATGWFGIPAPF